MKISYILPAVCISAIVAYPFQSVYALSAKEVSSIAEAITVRIDGQNPGSGVLIKRNGDTYTVLTAAHVIETEDEYEVITADEQRHELNYKRVKKFSKVDLALVEFSSSKSYQIADLGDSSAITSGDTIYVSGFPVPTEAITKSIWNFSSGEVTANAKRSLDDGYSLVYNNNTLSGMSGGAILNEQGKLIGIHGRADAEQQTKQTEIVYIKSGFNLGISINTFLSLVESKYPSLGFKGRTIAPLSSALTADDWYLSGSEKVSQGDYEGAILDFDRAIQANPEYAEAYIDRGFSFSNLGDDTQAVSDYSQAIKINPEAQRAHYNRGVIRSNKGDLKGAVTDFSKAIQINPRHLSAHNNRGTSYVKLGNNKLAIEDFKKTIQIDPNYAFAYNNLGSIHINLDDYSQAIIYFNRAVQIDSTYGQAYYNRGRAYLFLENFRAAIADNDIAISYLPDHFQAYNNRGLARSMANDKKGAISDFNKTLELNPNFFVAYINRGNVFREMKRAKKALEDFNKAIQISPDSTFALISRGNLLKSQGDKKGAIADFIDAARLYKNKGDQQSYDKILRAIQQLSSR